MHSVANASPARGWANNDIVKCMRQSDQDENYFCEMVYGVADHVEALDTIINEALELTRAYAGEPPRGFINGVLDNLAKQIRPDEVKKFK